MSAVERCRSAALGGHVLRCTGCFHVVFTMPSRIADIAYQNKAMIYNILFKAASQTLQTIAKDPKHLGASLGLTAVLHTWGSAMTHHPHLHCIVPGGGLSPDKRRWVACRKGFFLPVRVLSRLFRRLFLGLLEHAHEAGELKFYGAHTTLKSQADFARYLAPTKKIDWVVYAKRPFAGPESVLTYLSRYTHRIAIANSRLISANKNTVTFKCKDYRLTGDKRYTTMTLQTGEFIRRFLIHVLPSGFHRIRHYGLLSNKSRAHALSLAREHLQVVPEPEQEASEVIEKAVYVCRSCGEPMIIIDILSSDNLARAPPVPAMRR